MNHLCKGTAGVIATMLLLLVGLAQIRADNPSLFIENFDAFSGSGLSPSPAAGQLDSAVWRVSGFSDGDTAFNGSYTTGDFVRGVSTGGVSTGGLYAFDTGGGNIALGLQPTGNDFTPGNITLRLQNTTGLTITALNVSYQLWFLNDKSRAGALNFAYATDDATYTTLPDLNFTTPLTADALGWQAVTRTTVISPLAVPSNAYAYLQWVGDDAGGSGNRDELGLDNVQISFMPINTIPATITPAATQIITPTTTVTATVTPTATQTITPTPTVTVTPIITQTLTPTPPITPTPTIQPTPQPTGQPPPGAVVINEVAWGGTAAGSADEWLELYNTLPQTVTFSGWAITSTGGLNIPLDGLVIAPDGYFLIERTDDTAISDISADLIASFGRSGLNNGGDTIFLSANGVTIDTANINGGGWPAGSGSPSYVSMERLDASLPDSPANWAANNGIIRNGLDAAGGNINGTPKQVNSASLPPPPTPAPSPTPTPAPPLLISEFVYDGLTPGTEGDEFVEICNPNPITVTLTGYKIGDEESYPAATGEGMYQFTGGQLAAAACVVVAKNAADFTARFGRPPDFAVADLDKLGGNWSLSNTGDELLLFGPNNELLDSVAFRNGDYATLGLEAGATAPEPHSLQRVWPSDTASMPDDFVRTDPTPGYPTHPPATPAFVPPVALPNGMFAYWGHLHAHTTYSDGAGPPHYALALARAAGLHYYAITDHGWWTDESQWTRTLSQTQAATVPGQFIALRGVEWSHDSAGHLNIFNTDTLLHRRHPLYGSLSDIYTWLAANPHVVAQFNHPDPDYGGTFADFALHPAAAQMIAAQEIGNNAQRYTTYEPSFVQSNLAGWRTAPTINGDTHSALWGTDLPGRTGIIAPELTEVALLDALRARRVFATEDSNLALAVQAGDHWMGSVLTAGGSLSLTVHLSDFEAEPVTLHLFDNNLAAGNKIAQRNGHGLANAG